MDPEELIETDQAPLDDESRPRRRSPEPSQYEEVATAVAEGLSRQLDTLGDDDAAFDEAAHLLGVWPPSLGLLRAARALAAQTGLDEAIFFALGELGLPMRPEALVDIPTVELRGALEDAVEGGVVPAFADLEATVEALADTAVESLLGEHDVPMDWGIAEGLAQADLPSDALRELLRGYQRRTGTVTEFWDELSDGDDAQEEGGFSVHREARLAIEITALVGPDAALLRVLHEERRQGRWRVAEDLAELDFDDWCELIEDAEADVAEASGEAIESGEEFDELVEERAEALMDALEVEFPNVFLRKELLGSGELSPPAVGLLQRVPRHDFGAGSIRRAVEDNPVLLEGFEAEEVEVAMAEVEAVERVSRFTDFPEEVSVLLATGMDSAHAVASTPRRRFIELYADTLGGRPQAARVHAQAQQTAGASTLTMVRLLQALQSTPLVLGGAAGRDQLLKDVPDAQALFGSMGQCACEHCASVYSPAAYFVELLAYLDIRNPTRVAKLRDRLLRKGNSATDVDALLRHRPLEVLLARRPELAELPLTCENTHTPLPYIDIVNELLEARVAQTPAIHDTGKTPADVLVAVPQNLDDKAYDRLRRAVYPTSMPYHQPLDVVRSYLGHLGVTRLSLMKTLAKGDARGAPLLAEALGMSVEEFGLVSAAPTELHRHFGFDSPTVGFGRYIDALTQAPVLLSAMGMTFAELIEMLRTRFGNPRGEIVLEAPTPDCDPNKVRIKGLNEARLARMLRMLRVQRRLGWSLTDLDRTLASVGATDLTPATLGKLIEAREVAEQLDKPIAEVLVLWSSLDTFEDDSQFARLLQTRAVAWKAGHENTFELKPDRTDLMRIGPSLDAVGAALQAAFRITAEELAAARALVARSGTEAKLDLAGLSAVYRVALLARSFRLRIEQLAMFVPLLPAAADPFRTPQPAAVRRFVALLRQVADSDFKPETLAYLFHPPTTTRRALGPAGAQVRAVLDTVRSGLADARAQTQPTQNPNDDFLRQKLAMALDPALVKPAMDALNPGHASGLAQRRAFFDRHLARLFPDPAAARTRLFPGGSPPAVAEATATKPPATKPSPTASAKSGSTTPASPAASDTPRPEDPRWIAARAYTLEHLLPALRRRESRGAVIRSLGEALSLSSVATSHLLDQVMKSTPGSADSGPMLEQFLALGGGGLTGEYFDAANPEGSPATTRVDAKLSFAWAGAPPAPGVNRDDFSVRWTGRLLPRAKGPHTFFVTTDGAVKIVVKVGGEDRVVLDASATDNRSTEHASTAVELDPASLYEVKIEFRRQGPLAAFALQFGSSPTSKAAIPGHHLFPKDGPTSFEPVTRSYRRLDKAARLVTGLELSDAHLVWLTAQGRLDLDGLPMSSAQGQSKGVALLQRWRQLVSLQALRKKLPRGDTDLYAVLRAATPAAALTELLAATGWEKSTVEALLGAEGLALGSDALTLPADPAVEPPLLRLARAVDAHRRVGVAVPTLIAWASAPPDRDVAASVVQAVKARYDEKKWLEVAQSLNDPLRAKRRDALVEYLLPRLRDKGVTKRAQLFEYFLIDVEMNPCMLTSRIKEAISATQTFFQRSLMNLEAPKVQPRLIDNSDWKWLKSYRVWEANRKVFLYPENWIEPELRDDKTPIFKQFERTILQKEIKKENVEAAFLDYLQSLDEVARLDVRAVWFEPRSSDPGAAPPMERVGGPNNPPVSKWAVGTYHVFARTFNAPHAWFYRRLERGRTWTPWERIDTDIEGDHLVPVMYQRRLHLFWTVFREQAKPNEAMKKDAPPFTLGDDWEISVAYSVYERGRWTRKQMSNGAVLDKLQIPIRHVADIPRRGEKARDPKDPAAPPRLEGSAWFPTSIYTLRAEVRRSNLRLYVYRRAIARTRTGGASVPNPERLLRNADVDLAARFELDGCNGEVYPFGGGGLKKFEVRFGSVRRRRSLIDKIRGRRRGRIRARSSAPRTYANFNLGRGGRIGAPPGYQVSNTGLVPIGRVQGRTLRMPSSTGGTGVVLRRRPNGNNGVVIQPVIDPSNPGAVGLSPFFFADKKRTYFVMPVDQWQGAKMVRVAVARPLTGRRRSFARRWGIRVRRRRPVRRRRGEALAALGDAEALDVLEDNMLDPTDEPALEALDDEIHDEIEDEEDDAWHPDDAFERRGRRRRRRRRRPRAAALRRRLAAARRRAAAARRRGRQPVPTRLVRRQAGFERRLRFMAFDHPQTCRLILTLKEKGLDKLLSKNTTRPGNTPPIAPGRRPDHHYVNGVWTPLPARQNAFARGYRPGPLVDMTQLPAVDIDFDVDAPYGAYNWELFFHAPLQVAVRLAKEGRHDDAQRWFHYIFDPTTDVSTPPPQRYWRFAPFFENREMSSARELMALTSYSGSNQTLIARQAQVNKQIVGWWEKPFNPHFIARLRMVAYQKAVLMKYIDNLIEWGDKLFRKDTMESIQEAMQLYVLAANVLGKRPERIPPLVRRKPATFKEVRSKIDTFANWAVRIENDQVRRPFRINARPDASGATSILGMATQYFCIPSNPQMDKYWDTVDDRLRKIRNCMNIKGVVRKLALFEPPIDPGALVRAAAAGADLGSVAAGLNAPPPHLRYRVLLSQAEKLAEDVRGLGSSLLRALERHDTEAMAALHATQSTMHVEAVRDVRKLKLKRVEKDRAALAVRREGITQRMAEVIAEAQQLMRPQEEASQESMTEAHVWAGVAEGISLTGKVLHAIPDFQTGGSGAFGSPYATVQVGGTMFGNIAMAVAESAMNLATAFTAQAGMSAAQAEYQQRMAEKKQEYDQLEFLRQEVVTQIDALSLELQMHNTELRKHDVALENSKTIERVLRDKFTNVDLYGWMMGQLSTVYFQAYKLAFDAAKLAERAYVFEHGDTSASFIQFSYWDSLKKGLHAGERLRLDLRRMETARAAAAERQLEVTRHVSLRRDFPQAFAKLVGTGRCEFAVSESLLDGDFPGHYFRRIKTVALSAVGKFDRFANVNCVVTMLQNRVRSDSNARGPYARSEDGDDPRFISDLVPIETLATSQPSGDSGMFELKLDDGRYLPFEGAGAISQWRLELRQANNAFDVSQVEDVVLSISYSARDGGQLLASAATGARNKAMARGQLQPPVTHMISLRRELPDVWKQLGAGGGKSVEAKLDLSVAALGGRYRGKSVRVQSVEIFGHAATPTPTDALRAELKPGKGAATPITSWSRPFATAATLRGTAALSGEPGLWTMTIGGKDKPASELFDDIVVLVSWVVKDRS